LNQGSKPEAVLALTPEQAHPAEERSVSHPSVSSILKCWLREPLLHFMVLGVALFGIHAYIHRGHGGVESSKQIALTIDDLRQMALVFESKWKREPTPQELQGMVEDKFREEVLYREGLAIGLDKDDTIVKRRMAQKMEFLAEDVATAQEPSTVELKAWFDKNKEKFALPSRYSFRHLYFSPDKRGQNAQEDATKALTKIAGQPEESKQAASLADQFMFQDYYGDRTSEAIAKEFGPHFAVALEELKPGSWQGPIESGYGWHLVFVTTVIRGRIPALEEVEPEVKTAWLGEQKAQAWQKAYVEMRAKYTLLLPAPQENEAAKTQPPPPKKQAPDFLGE
jgi:peptidyl-prolyl cis-trans isomerase C